MNLQNLKEKPIWQMTGGEFLFLQQNGGQNIKVDTPVVKVCLWHTWYSPTFRVQYADSSSD